MSNIFNNGMRAAIPDIVASTELRGIEPPENRTIILCARVVAAAALAYASAIESRASHLDESVALCRLHRTFRELSLESFRRNEPQTPQQNSRA